MNKKIFWVLEIALLFVSFVSAKDITSRFFVNENIFKGVSLCWDLSL